MLFRKRYQPKSDDEIRDQLKNAKLEKKDVPAMVIAAFIVFLPAILLVIGIFVLIFWLFFLRYA